MPWACRGSDLYGMLVQRLRVPVDHKCFLMAQRSTAHDGHLHGVSTVQVPQVEKNGRFFIVLTSDYLQRRWWLAAHFLRALFPSSLPPHRQDVV